MVGCATLLVVGGVVAWQYRAQLEGAWRSVTAGGGPVAGDTMSVGVASDDALASAFAKQEGMARQDGPGVVTLTAEEMASLIRWGLGPLARGALDSMRVELTLDRFALLALLDTRILSEELLGPFRGMIRGHEPLRMAGPARVASTGVVAWQPDEFVIRAFPFPAAAVPRLVNALTAGTDGTIPIAVPPTVGEMRIRPDGVSFYRRID